MVKRINCSFFNQMKDEAKNKKKVKFNVKPEIINSNDYQSIENKKSHKVWFYNQRNAQNQKIQKSRPK
jgi:hypothetical protein